MSERPWELRVAPSAERQLSRLPEKVAAAVATFLVGPLAEHPRQVGHPLRQELEGLWSAPRGAYRIAYEVDGDEGVVMVVRIDHRADVYRQR